MDLLGRHPWPGNVRELENLMERLVILTEGEVIDVADLPEKFQRLTLPPRSRSRRVPGQGRPISPPPCRPSSGASSSRPWNRATG